MNYLELKDKIEAMHPDQQKCRIAIQIGWDRDFFNVDQLEFAQEPDELPENYPYLTVLGAYPGVGLAERYYRFLSGFVRRFKKETI